LTINIFGWTLCLERIIEMMSVLKIVTPQGLEMNHIPGKHSIINGSATGQKSMQFYLSHGVKGLFGSPTLQLIMTHPGNVLVRTGKYHV